MKMEGYLFDPATVTSTDYAETATTFAPAKSATLPTSPIMPTAVIAYPTNLVGDIRYQIRFKVLTAANVTSITLWGGSNSISHIHLPISEAQELGQRGALAIESADGVAGTYDSTIRKLTMPNSLVATNDTRYLAAITNGQNEVTLGFLPYSPFSGTITPANGTATVTYAVGSMPSLTLTEATVLTLDPTSYGTSGVSRVSLSLYCGTNAVTLATNVITYATTPTLSTNTWNTILIRRVSNDSWKGVQL
jgi:hypothetical protein